jgi:GNAT superfamily N-acetyltransferase
MSALNAQLRAQYPEPEATHFELNPLEVAAGESTFPVGYLDEEAVACGALRCLAEHVAEIKRMFVVSHARGRGFSGAILSAPLENAARELGVRRLILETGPRQLPALALYRRAGFVPIQRFGEYVGSELSLCMAKELEPG